MIVTKVYLPPAYVVRREGNVLTRVCLSVHRGVSPARGGGGSVQSSWGGGQSSLGEGGQLGGGSAKIGQQNRISTHYTAGGMPLAFPQEDFLVYS